MTRTTSALCPTCGQSHSAKDTFGYYGPKPNIEICNECRVREATALANTAKEKAYDVPRRCLNHLDAMTVFSAAQHEVMIEMLCRGSTKLETLKNVAKYWRAVEEKLK